MKKKIISDNEKIEDLELNNTDGLINRRTKWSSKKRNNSGIDQLDKMPKTKRVLKIIKSIVNFFTVFNKIKEFKKPHGENEVSR